MWSLDGGTTWGAYNLGLPVLRGDTIAFSPYEPGKLIVGTAGRGFFYTVVPEPTLLASLAVGASLLLRRGR